MKMVILVLASSLKSSILNIDNHQLGSATLKWGSKNVGTMGFLPR